MKTTRIAVPVIAALLMCGCSKGTPVKGTVPIVTTVAPPVTSLETRAAFKKETLSYTFVKIGYDDFWSAAADKTYCGEWIYGAVTEERCALFYGKLRTLFGEPNETSDDWENMYNYYIECDAESENGTETMYFIVYHGSGGPSLSVPAMPDETEEASYEAAKRALIRCIESADPADYIWEGTYYDIPVDVTYKVENGRAEVTSRFPDEASLSDFEDML